MKSWYNWNKLVPTLLEFHLVSFRLLFFNKIIQSLLTCNHVKSQSKSANRVCSHFLLKVWIQESIFLSTNLQSLILWFCSQDKLTNKTLHLNNKKPVITYYSIIRFPLTCKSLYVRFSSSLSATMQLIYVSICVWKSSSSFFFSLFSFSLT